MECIYSIEIRNAAKYPLYVYHGNSYGNEVPYFGGYKDLCLIVTYYFGSLMTQKMKLFEYVSYLGYYVYRNG